MKLTNGQRKRLLKCTQKRPKSKYVRKEFPLKAVEPTLSIIVISYLSTTFVITFHFLLAFRLRRLVTPIELTRLHAIQELAMIAV